MMVRVYDAHPHPDELADQRNDDVEPALLQNSALKRDVPLPHQP